MPAGPIRKCRLAANSTAISRSIIRTMTYGDESWSNGTSSSAASATRPTAFHARGNGRSGVSIAALPRAAACGRPKRPQGRHTSTTAITRNSTTRVSLLSGNGDPEEVDRAGGDDESLDHGDQQGGDKGAEDRTHAADDDDHEGLADQCQVEVQVRRLVRHLQGAAERGQEGAEGEHRVKSQRWLTPSAPTISRSWVAARTSRPQRVRVSSSQSRPRTSGPTKIENRS